MFIKILTNSEAEIITSHTSVCMSGYLKYQVVLLMEKGMLYRSVKCGAESPSKTFRNVNRWFILESYNNYQ